MKYYIFAKRMQMQVVVVLTTYGALSCELAFLHSLAICFTLVAQSAPKNVLIHKALISLFYIISNKDAYISTQYLTLFGKLLTWEFFL